MAPLDRVPLEVQGWRFVRPVSYIEIERTVARAFDYEPEELHGRWVGHEESGARSIVFHQWFHGDDVHCALVFEAGHEHHDQGHSEEDQHVGKDRLSPFCESGSLDLTYSSAFLFLAPCIEVMPTFLHDAPELTWTRSASPRAPPAWV